METILIILALTMISAQWVLMFLVFVSFYKENKELPKVEIPNPVQAVKEHKANKEAKKELDRLETILANIENYDGTSNNQANVPGR